MKTALITTTISVPHVLKTYRAIGPDVAFFIAGDHKTPVAGVLHEYRYYSVADQKKLNYRCSELIGWNCIQRRNIALLEAVRWGAEVIVSVDDDNIPLTASHFSWFDLALSAPFHGAAVHGFNGWFDVGRLLLPPARHRGFPLGIDPLWGVRPAANLKVGVAAGACLGDPDVDAVTRIATAPECHGISELLRGGVVVHLDTWTVFNSQNTAFLRELAPAMFMPPGIGRYDDIVASLICQRVMRERGLHVHFGLPAIWQQRNQHKLLADLVAEHWGMEHLVEIAELLRNTDLNLESAPSVVDMVRSLWGQLQACGLFPRRSCESAFAFLLDIERVL